MNKIENLPFTKAQYTLQDFAVFKLCPALYAYSVIFPDKAPATDEQRLLMLEAEILKLAFSEFASTSEKEDRWFFSSTSKCVTLIFEQVNHICKNLYLNGKIQNDEMLKKILINVYEKADMIIQGIQRWAKGGRYTIVSGVHKQYDFENFKFIYRSSFRAIDYHLKRYKTLYINEYETFPVLSAGVKGKDLIHYRDILSALSKNAPGTDRVGLAMKIIKKINTQLESTLYIDDGYERIKALATEIESYDFSNCHKKKSDFCRFCKFFDKCC